MSAFIRNYFQHIMDVILNDEYTYSDLCDAYGDLIEATKESLHKAYKRGNLPRGITPEQFYLLIIETCYHNLHELKDFARKLVVRLKNDSIFPEVWNDRITMVDGFSDNFDADIFHTFIVDLLTQDKESRKKKRAVANTSADSKKAKGTEEAVSEEIPSALSFSERFFTTGAVSVVNMPDEELEHELAKQSAVFSSISAVRFKNGSTPLFDGDNMLTYIREYILSCIDSQVNKEILKIEGPLGSYKNRIMQYLYIALERRAKGFIPIYIDIACYEKAAETSELIGEKDFLAAFEKDISTAERIVAESAGKKPLLMLDGVRDFKCKNEALYYSIDQRIKKLGWYRVVCIDTEFTVNTQNRYTVHPLSSNNYECCWRISSMNLNRRSESLKFIKNCISAFNISLTEEVTAEKIYDSLVKLEFLTIDAYWLTYILNTSLNEILDRNNDISCLYDSICLSFLGSVNLVESAAEFAYEFEFGKKCFDTTNPYYDLRWRLLRKHRSVLDFLIAKFYIKKVSELDLENGSKSRNLEKLSFFNMVLQKSITRFVVAMLKGVDDYEKQIMIIARRYYDNLDLFGKSELTFWMARLKNKSRKNQCVELLREYKRKELERYNSGKFTSMEEKRKAAFLIRGIYVSLIYENDRTALADYIDSLLKDKTADSVNRGFYLEYYGDKPYIPNKTLLDFEDDISKGEAAFTALCLSLDGRSRKHKAPHQVCVLEVMTLCNLIQARIEKNDDAVAMDVSPYIKKCIKYLDWIMNQGVMMSVGNAFMFFRWFRGQLESFEDDLKAGRKPVYHQAEVMNKFSRVSDVKRTGWVEYRVPDPESIAEHMYNCWMIGMLYLPETDTASGYCKNDILSMLLIHDLAETETGDISRPVKNTNRSYYDNRERDIMQGLFLSGTYPSSESLSGYMDLWNTWSSGRGINYSVAKDIDNIQAINRFCSYYLKYPDIFTEDDADYWLDGLTHIETDVGRHIADKLIVNNPAYEAITKLLDFREY